ncbi:MFS transporter [Fodinibius sediminis]|uniref:Nitrate/nitrite transporter NarK n=1 Tax=Fodinibius sediminis TaxID=1214077 RepID=A0A521AVR8_9BACT|nr:MFS transporter [Fodinibius sediminis]SMO38670.1 Nitrate/nitrite transporter NarK [Fodinibius sediminis]
MQKIIKQDKLFIASCLALLVTSLSFGIRAGIMYDLMEQFRLNASQMGLIAGTAFWGFPLAIVVGGMIVDIVGMKRLFIFAFLLHLVGIVFTIFSTGFYSLYISTLFIGVANGTVEAAGNPLVATIYPDNKTTKLNHFHIWFPGGIVIGTLISFGMAKVSLGWEWQMAMMIIPTIIYGYMFYRLDVPVTERVSAGVPTKEMYRAVLRPLFIFMFICMIGTAVTELFINQWVGVLLENVTNSSILVLALISAIQAFGRGVAGPIVTRISPSGLLLISSVFSTIGLYLLATLSGNSIFIAAIVFGLGVTYFWPTMLGFVSENIPESGALGLNLLGGVGTLSVSVYMFFMGEYYDKLIALALPTGADIDVYRSAADGTSEAQAFLQAKIAAGPEVIEATIVIPLFLTFAFLFLYIYMKVYGDKTR